MVLETINSPADLRNLNHIALRKLCTEIRAFIVDAVTNASGHLGSNLGIVELTVALHRVFESPNDIILWDTGHQAYVHKILTGRRDQFDTLRKAGGLSGYPDRSESEHDWIENSHASTVLSYAHGLATAQEAAGGDGRRIIAVVGDGSMTGGMAFEGLNNLGHSGRNVTIVLNDNGRSYAPTVSRLGESLARLRLNPRFVRQNDRLDRLIGEIPIVGKEVERAIDATKAAIREYWEPTSFFENLGVGYHGPFDGHDIAGLEIALEQAAALPGPQVVHVRTQKGRGYAPAENDPIKHMHDMGSIQPGTCAQAFQETLIKLGEQHPNLVALTAAMPDSTGVLAYSERFPDRAFDVGIAEQHAVTAAAGMAMGGLRPVVALYATFLTRAIDQVNLDVGLHGQPVIFCLDRAGITGSDGPSHHGILDMVLLTKVPGMTVMAPSSYQEVQVMLEDAMDITDGPVAIRWPKTLRSVVPETEVGRGLHARKVRTGPDGCILSVGKLLDRAEGAADALAADGHHVSVWDVRVCAPLDPEMIVDAATHPWVVTIEDGIAAGGVGAAAADEIHAQAPTVPVKAMGIPVAHIPHGDVDTILRDLGLDAPGIADAARQLLESLPS